MGIELINVDNVISRSQESKNINLLNKKKFYQFMSRYGFKVTVMMYIRKFTKDEAEKFNELLRKAKDKIKINMFEMVLFLEDDFTTIGLILSSLDERNKDIIKEEMAHEFNLDYGNDTTISELVENG